MTRQSSIQNNKYHGNMCSEVKAKLKKNSVKCVLNVNSRFFISVIAYLNFITSVSSYTRQNFPLYQVQGRCHIDTLLYGAFCRFSLSSYYLF